MFEWSLENLIRTCLYLACFFTVVGLGKFIIFSLKILKMKKQNKKIKPSFLFDEVYTFQSVAAFFIGFGWLGYFLLKQHNPSTTYCMISAVIAGFICLQISVKTMFKIKKNLFEETEKEMRIEGNCLGCPVDEKNSEENKEEAKGEVKEDFSDNQPQ